MELERMRRGQGTSAGDLPTGNSTSGWGGGAGAAALRDDRLRRARAAGWFWLARTRGPPGAGAAARVGNGSSSVFGCLASGASSAAVSSRERFLMPPSPGAGSAAPASPAAGGASSAFTSGSWAAGGSAGAAVSAAGASAAGGASTAGCNGTRVWAEKLASGSAVSCAANARLRHVRLRRLGAGAETKDARQLAVHVQPTA